MSIAKVNPDIKEERDKVQFNVEEFTHWYYDGAEKVEAKRFLERYFLEDPELKPEMDMSYMSHKEKYEEAIRRTTVALKKIKKLQSEGHVSNNIYDRIAGGMFLTSILREGNPIGLHYGMFLPALRNLGTIEQQAEWIPKAWNLNIIGTYAQTEMGHGTFIRGLETTSTYDAQTKEFVLHSPKITAYKWWPGGLGHTCNYVVAFAQLYTQGKHRGLHPFIVQIRDLETHKPLPGIIVGEIGNKIGFNTVNNGFLGFENVRVPLKHMLMKNAKVLENGDFVRQKSSVLAYGTMTQVRVGIVRDTTVHVSKAATIAMRYATVRRQSPIDPNQPEPKIIEHVTQQMKIFPAIAKIIVVKAAADNLIELNTEVLQELEKGNLERLPELHAMSCCLKAVCTNEATQTVEILRLACGGHGYLSSSGLHDIYKMASAAQHMEGDNTVLSLQTARFLMKSWAQALKGEKLTPTVAYLKDFVNPKGRLYFDDSINGILRALQAAAAGATASAFSHLEARKKVLAAEEATNQTGIELVNAAELHCHVFIMQSAIASINHSIKTLSPALGSVFRDVLELYSVDFTLKKLGSLIQFSEITSKDVEKLQERLEAVLKRFRVNAIGIVDGFDISDLVLGSTLGAYDGNVYERLLSEAKKSPLNQENVNKSFDLHLKPFMKSNL